MRQPTDGELAILRVLWARGPSTVREVRGALAEAGDGRTGYTTTLKLMQIMAGKDLVTRDDSSRSHVYEARWSEEQMQRRMLGDLMQRVFGGSASAVVVQALNTGTTSAKELRKIQALIEAFRRKNGGR